MSTQAVTASDPAPLVTVRDDDEARRRRVREALQQDGLTVVDTDTDAAEILVVGVELRRAADVDALLAVVSPPGAPADSPPSSVPEPARVVLVVSHADRSLLERALRAGVLGCVAEADLEEHLASTVRGVAAGLAILPGDFFAEPPPPVFSQREKQVLGMVVLGFTNAEIAGKLFLAESTIKSHLSSSFAKLGVRSRTEASARILDPRNRLGLGILAISEAGPQGEAAIAPRSPDD